MTAQLTGDEYIALLQRRQDEWVAAQAQRPFRVRFTPLLEDFVEPGDEDLVDPTVYAPAPPQPKQTPTKRTPKPRKYRSAESLRAERDRVQARRDAIAARDCRDVAIVNLGPSSRNSRFARAGRRRFEQMDRDLQRYTQLTAKLADLGGRIARAEAREADQIEVAPMNTLDGFILDQLSAANGVLPRITIVYRARAALGSVRPNDALSRMEGRGLVSVTDGVVHLATK